jgi:hypothetical protein
MGIFDIVWDVQQEGRIAEAKTDASIAKNEVTRYKERIYDLEFSVQRMALTSQALWEILRSSLGITEAELLAKIHEIDLRDGKNDQRMSAQLTTCPTCRKTLNSKHSRCLYCGEPVQKPHIYQ